MSLQTPVGYQEYLETRKKMKLIAIGSHYHVETVFKPMFTSFTLMHSNHGLKDIVDEDTVLLFGGGEDIDPKIYNEVPHPRTQKAFRLSGRDPTEIEAFKIGKEHGAKMLGICRGAQLLCALSGGKLVQDVDGHHGTHEIQTSKGEVYWTSSVHHQMMFPFKVKHQMIAWSKHSLSKDYWMNDKINLKKLPVEPEIVYFPESKSLAIQGHPEFMGNTEPFVTYVRNLVTEYLFK